MLRQFIKITFGIVLGSILFACANRRIADKPIRVDRLERRKTSELVAVLENLSQLRPKTLYTKIKCNFSDTNQTIGFKTSIRLIKDSILNPIITYAGIPIASAILRPDSVIISNKREKCVVRRNVGFIKESFGVDFDYRNIEEMILGLPIGFDTMQKYFQINDPSNINYIITTKKNRAIRRDLRGKPERERDRNGILNRREDREEEKEDNVLLEYFINPIYQTIDRIRIDSPDDTTRISIDYLSRDSVENYMIPNEVHIEIVTPRNHIVIEMDYDKTEVNQPQDIYFVIPEEYEECTPKQ